MILNREQAEMLVGGEGVLKILESRVRPGESLGPVPGGATLERVLAGKPAAYRLRGRDSEVAAAIDHIDLVKRNRSDGWQCEHCGAELFRDRSCPHCGSDDARRAHERWFVAQLAPSRRRLPT